MSKDTFNPNHTYRCTIIRGKSQEDMDDLLPKYAQIISDICPARKEDFNQQFNEDLSQFIYHKAFDDLPKNHQKTIRNHITEIAGKLFGLYFYNTENVYFESPSCAKLMEDGDQPAFFKNLCLNFQFPNASQKITTVLERIADGINIKPFHFVISLLNEAKQENIRLTKTEVGCYVLNARQVLQGKVSVETVLSRIIEDRKNNNTVKIIKNSNNWQHIKEQFNLLILSNILIEQGDYLLLNDLEDKAISYFITQLDKPLQFSFENYFLDGSDKSSEKRMFADWSEYHGKVATNDEDVLNTQIIPSIKEITTESKSTQEKTSKQVLGEAGELFVFDFEKERVKRTHPRLVNQIKLIANQRGMGYDISSVEAGENLSEPEFKRMIEVKSTKRVTAPNLEDNSWIDTVTLTRREWMSAKQYRETYNIYRVYFTPVLTLIRKINDPYSKSESNDISVIPTQYRMDFSSNAIDGEYK